MSSRACSFLNLSCSCFKESVELLLLTVECNLRKSPGPSANVSTSSGLWINFHFCNWFCRNPVHVEFVDIKCTFCRMLWIRIRTFQSIIIIRVYTNLPCRMIERSALCNRGKTIPAVRACCTESLHILLKPWVTWIVLNGRIIISKQNFIAAWFWSLESNPWETFNAGILTVLNACSCFPITSF